MRAPRSKPAEQDPAANVMNDTAAELETLVA
jgi:hypothetical protein